MNIKDEPGMSTSKLYEPELSEYGEDGDYLDGQNSSDIRAVHQCNVCNKIFLTFRGLQQHAIIHTDLKPFQCDICSKKFRFKSNLFEHMSVHTGYAPHACPYCGKTCRLKGNLKKHIRMHVNSKDELETAWRPFITARRRSEPIPENAIIIRSSGSVYALPNRVGKKLKLGLGCDTSQWVRKLKMGELLPLPNMDHKVATMEAHIMENVTEIEAVFDLAKSIPFERYDCPDCKAPFDCRWDCETHLNMEHPATSKSDEFLCSVCERKFLDDDSLKQHDSYHERIKTMMGSQELVVTEPPILLPTEEDWSAFYAEPGDEFIPQSAVIVPKQEPL